MRYMKHILIGCFAVVTMAGCLIDSSSDRITGKYIVPWIDHSLSKEYELHSPSSSDILQPYVFAVGHNKDYIIAKQYPTSGFPGFQIHSDTTNYYIIDILNEKDSVYGPLTCKKFDSLRTLLKITDIPFEKTYPYVP